MRGAAHDRDWARTIAAGHRPPWAVADAMNIYRSAAGRDAIRAFARRA